MSEPSPASASAPGIDVSVVIVVFRTPDYLRRCLEALRRARPGLRWEVVVQDNAPLDRVSELLTEDWRTELDAVLEPDAFRPPVHYQRNDKNLGFARAVNQGIRCGSGRYFFILNPDVEVEPGCLETLVEFLDREPSVGIAAPRLHYPDGSLQYSCRTFYTLPIFLLRRTFLSKLIPDSSIIRDHLMSDWDHEDVRDIDWCIGGCLIVRREAVEDVGPMDERFFLYFEDVDWCYRMHQRSWRVVYQPQARAVHHYQRASAGWKPSRGFWLHVASTVRFYEKWSFVLYWLKRRSRLFRQIAFVASDLFAVALAFIVAYGLRAAASPILAKPLFPFETYTRFLVFTLVVSVGSFFALGLYRDRLRAAFWDNFRPVAQSLAWTFALMLLATFLFTIRTTHSRAVVFLFFPLAAVMVTTGRVALLRLVESVRDRDLNVRRVALLGPQSAVEETWRRFESERPRGVEPVAVVVGAGETSVEPAELRRTLRDQRIQDVVLFEETPGGVARLLDELRREDFRIFLVPALREVWPRYGQVGRFVGLPTVAVSDRIDARPPRTRLRDRWRRWRASRRPPAPGETGTGSTLTSPAGSEDEER